MKHIYQILLIVILLIKYTKCLCNGITHYTAEEQSQLLHNRDNSGRSHGCTFFISPRNDLSTGYFLKIKWYNILIPDDMPDCKYFYIEIFLTRYYRSIGRFCSKNIGGVLPFNMYSFDGHAKIYYYIGQEGSKTVFEFELSYALMETQRDYLSSSSSCLHTESKKSSGVIHSSGWPNENYYFSLPSCTYNINEGTSKVTKIIFMDVALAAQNIYSSCKATDNDDYLEVRGTDREWESFANRKIIQTRICSPQSVTTSYKYISIKFNRKMSARNKNRGFLIGYIVYDKRTDLSTAAIVGISVSAVLLFIFIVACCWCRSRGRAKRTVQRSATAEQELTAGTENVIVNEQSAYPSNFNFPAGTVLTSNDQPPAYTPTLVSHHETPGSSLALPNEPPPSYDDVLLMQPMGAQNVNNAGTHENASTSPKQSTNPVNDG